jgi:hypothetical protein
MPPPAASGASASGAAGAAGAADTSGAVTLSDIRATLIRQEDTIIFALIERAQFALNPPVYAANALPVPGASRCPSRCPRCPRLLTLGRTTTAAISPHPLCCCRLHSSDPSSPLPPS